MKNLTKNTILSFCLMLCIVKPFAQEASIEKINPFENINFFDKPTKNVTLTVDFNHTVGELSKTNIDLISLVSEHTGENLKKLKYAVGFKIPGYSQTFYVPCKDRTIYKTLVSRQQSIKKLKLECVVYRFYHMDVASNFFIINKVTILD